MKRLFYWVFFAAAGVLGCSHPTAPPFPDHLRGIPSESNNGGFSLYLVAAEEVERDAPKQIVRTTWTPGQKDAAIRNSQRALSTLMKGIAARPKFVFAPHSPITIRGPVRGWRFVGRVMQWEIERDLDEKGTGPAVGRFLSAARFGADMTGGDALYAGLGYEIIEKAAQPLWKAFATLSATDLRRLSSGVAAIMRDMPSARMTIAHERQTMLADVQWVQERFLQNDFAAIRSALGTTVDPAIRYLRELKNKAISEQVKYFERFGREADEEAKQLSELAAISPSQRTEASEPTGERPWRRFAANYFRTGRAYLEEKALSETKMKLLAADSALLAAYKSGHAAKDLSLIPKWLRTDPYSGRDFVYAAQGANYKLYSVGPDNRDDGGEEGQDVLIGR